MKTIIISIVTIILGITTFVSCQESNTAEPPTVVGRWLLIESSIKTSNADIDPILNSMFEQAILNLDTERDFYAKINSGDPTAAVLTIRTKKNSSEAPFQTREEYAIDKDTLIVGSTRSVYLLSNKRLTAIRTLSYTDLVTMVADLGIIDPNTLPTGITGIYTTQEVKIVSQ